MSHIGATAGNVSLRSFSKPGNGGNRESQLMHANVIEGRFVHVQSPETRRRHTPVFIVSWLRAALQNRGAELRRRRCTARPGGPERHPSLRGRGLNMGAAEMGPAPQLQRLLGRDSSTGGESPSIANSGEILASEACILSAASGRRWKCNQPEKRLFG